MPDRNLPEVNGLSLGEWTFDVFITASGSLGFTVYEKGNDNSSESAPAVDIFVDANTMEVHAG